MAVFHATDKVQQHDDQISPTRHNLLAAMIHRLLNYQTELIDELFSSEAPSPHTQKKCHLSVVKSYLWALWTRSLQLFFWYVLRTMLAYGYDEEWAGLLALRGNKIITSETRESLRGRGSNMVSYMCSWALELLLSSRASVGQDFRYFHEAYGRLHGEKSARCLWQEDRACAGDDPLKCGRFKDKRLAADEQSVHTCHGGGCKRVVWDRRSYSSVDGPVGVSIYARPWSPYKVRYTKVTSNTMAISHVWSHGHGGRPATGMNKCLHETFSKIAKSHGCDSYWIDTLCIPEEHDLRKQAILNINRIFSTSKLVLVIDKDLTRIDVSSRSAQLLESLLATFLVCNWNVRAWTMLEAIKGCGNLHILCANNEIISLRDCLTEVHQRGRIDLVVIFLANQHLLPNRVSGDGVAQIVQSLESAGSLLSHRHATREGDDIVIWSLLSRSGTFFDAESMWKALVGRQIRTAFLMSNAPRLNQLAGFSWAPRRPYIRTSYDDQAPAFSKGLLVYDGADSPTAKITSKGLEGPWFVYKVTREHDIQYKDYSVVAGVEKDHNSGMKHASGGDVVLENKCWTAATELLNSNRFVILIQPMSERHGDRYRPHSDRGGTIGNRYAICTSDNELKWVWQIAQNWPWSVPSPPMEVEDLLLI